MNSRLDAGLAVAASVPGVTITGVVKAGATSWELPIAIDATSASSLIPKVTPWIVRIDRAYPYGSIAVFPARDGVTATFQHQEANKERAGSCRSGKLCLDNPYRDRTIVLERDPIGDADMRIAWHLARAQEWVSRAAAGDLVRDGDPFELPKVNTLTGVLRVIHDESSRSLATWRPHVGKFGQVHFRRTPVRNTVVASEFIAHDQARQLIRTSDLFLDEPPAREVHGIWWLWPASIVIDPWQPATTWGELASAGKLQGIDAFAALEQISYAVRKADRGRLFLMVGYPIPEKIGGPDHEVHWETVWLPALSTAPPKGFRPQPKFWWQRDRQLHFGDKRTMEYVETENWHANRVQARGRLPESVYRKKVAIIGCGALGSTVAELLIRAGLLELMLVDGEVLEAGNLARHILTSTSVGRGKAHELAKRFREISPSAKISAVGHHLHDAQTVHDRLDEADLVLDCTGADEIPMLLAATYWGVPRRFISASFGYGARRLLLFRSFGTSFPASNFLSDVEPWLAKERLVWKASGELHAGAGCYSPLFPARADDVAAGAIAVVKFIEETVETRCDEAELVVLQSSRYGGFRPIKHVEDVEDVGVRAA